MTIGGAGTSVGGGPCGGGGMWPDDPLLPLVEALVLALVDPLDALLPKLLDPPVAPLDVLDVLVTPDDVDEALLG